ncbi:MAG: ABC transporter substrate-binding protein [Gaiellaceae bacterium]
MRRRLWFAVVTSAIGLGMLLAAGFASPAESGSQDATKASGRGGTLRIDSRSDFDYVDPALAYFSHTFGQMLAAVCAQLYEYPDVEGNAGVRPKPMTAAGFPKVSRGGLRYTITVKNGFAKFQNGEPVTAKSYVDAINRDLDPKMQSPATAYLEEFKGAKAVLANKAKTASGVKVIGGNKIQIDLVKPVPDMTNRLTMSFFCPVPKGISRNPEGVGAPFSGGGPYYVKEWIPRRSAVIERNPNWKGAIAKLRPANVDRMEYTFGLSTAATKLRLDRNETDLGGIPPADVAEVAQKYGINKGRFFLRKQMVFWYLAMNHERPMFGPSGAGNVGLAKAVNYAVDRPSLVRQFGYLAGARTDQVIPYTMPGFRNWDIYPIRGSNFTKANTLAEGKKRDGNVVFYTFNTAPGPQIAQVVQGNLKQIGLDVEIKTFDRVVQNEKAGNRGEPFDMTFEGWGADYADAVTFFNTLLWGGNIQQSHNANISYFNSPKFNKLILKAASTAGSKRNVAYANLDRAIMRDAAPIAPFINSNARIYVSERVGCYRFAPAHGVSNLVAICLK